MTRYWILRSAILERSVIISCHRLNGEMIKCIMIKHSYQIISSYHGDCIYFILACYCLVPKLCPTLLWPHGACQAPLSMEFPKQEYWSGFPFPSLGDLHDPGIEPICLALAGRFFISEPARKPHTHIDSMCKIYIITFHPLSGMCVCKCLYFLLW